MKKGNGRKTALVREEVRSPPVVGIGASAGGLEAFVRLMSHLAKNSGLAYVLVQHLDPAHPSQLSEILNRSGAIPVVDAVDGVRLKANHAYVIPPNASMTVTDGHLRVATAERRRGVHTVIDEFLRSLAAIHQSEAVGVILSGSGSDGALGIEAIKEAGGITFAQDPNSAQFPSMPESAIESGSIDFILTPEQIADQLSLIAAHPAVQTASDRAAPDSDGDVQQILSLLHGRTGADFRAYRQATVHRRILRRMLVHKSRTHAELLTHLQSNPEDLDLLHQDLLIGVTRFFRDPEMFAALRDAAFGEMMKGHVADTPIRVWVAGCSTGEEAYSMAIALIEFLDATGASDTSIDLFATDLSDVAIAHARSGLYPLSIEADVSAERLSRFFIKEEGGYRVTRRVRDLCVFATQNVIRDPPFSQLDVISCRNLLIYFEPALQERVIPMFNFALKRSGILVIGGAESVGSSIEYFFPLDKRNRIFRPQPTSRRTLDVNHVAGFAPIPRLSPTKDRITLVVPPDGVRNEADRAVLARFGPPGVVVNDRLEITQFRGDTSGFVQHASGVANLNLLKLVRSELLPRLRAAVEMARTANTAVREDRIAVRDGDIVRHVAVEVMPLPVGEGRERFFVVLFDDAPTPPVRLTNPTKQPKAGAKRSAAADAEAVSARSISGLRDELSESKRYLQDVIDQYEGTNEELRAANEEIQSSNEELQSTIEELETTKEEIQSTNEELSTVNEELRHRNREIAAASADIANVFASTHLPILIVDGTLAVRRFTPVTERVITLIPTDVGRPLGDLRLRVDLPDLEARISTVISTQKIGQVDVQDDVGRWWSLTIRPYLTVENQVDGAVLVFTDIDASTLASQHNDSTSENRRVLLQESQDTSENRRVQLVASEGTSETRRVALVESEAGRIEADESNIVKTSFLANMSHDLRTPLNAIAGYADILELMVHGPLTTDQGQDVARIKRSARHLLSLINDILNFAKIEAGTTDLQIERVDVDAAVASLDAMLYPQLRAKGLTFAHTGCGHVVLADPEKLQQVLLNLATNAIKFTPSGGISIRCDSDDTTVTVNVTDTGVGIPADKLEPIFEPFIQVSRSLTNVSHDGVGLGLAISRNLARAMGGELTARSTPGQGSTFSLSLPRAHLQVAIPA